MSLVCDLSLKQTRERRSPPSADHAACQHESGYCELQLPPLPQADTAIQHQRPGGRDAASTVAGPSASPPRVRPTTADATSQPPLRRAQSNCKKILLFTLNDGAWTARRLECKSWGCKNCRKKLASRWLRTLETCSFEPRVFLTLTLNPEKLAQEGILHDHLAQRDWLRKRWTRFVQQVRRDHGPTSYFRVYERHSGRRRDKRGIRNTRLHVHVLLSTSGRGGGFSPFARRLHRPLRLRRYDGRRDYFRHLAQRHGWGHTSAYDVVPDQALAGYLFKYTLKLHDSAYRYRVRLVSCSQDIRHPRTTPTPVSDWFLATFQQEGIYQNPIQALAEQTPFPITIERDTATLPNVRQLMRKLPLSATHNPRVAALWNPYSRSLNSERMSRSSSCSWVTSRDEIELSPSL